MNQNSQMNKCRKALPEREKAPFATIPEQASEVGVHQDVEVVADEGTEVTVQQETHGRIYYNILEKKCNFIFFYSLLPNG